MSDAVRKPKLFIRWIVWEKMMYFTRNKDDDECSGLGLLEVTPEGDFIAIDTFMVPQVNSSAETEMDPDGIGQAMFKHKDHPTALVKWHWHSHVNMSAFWSGTDDVMIRQNSKHGWFLHTVINRKQERKTCLAQQKPFNFYIEDIETLIEAPPIKTELIDAWNSEYTENVKKKSYGHASSYGNSSYDDPKKKDQESREMSLSKYVSWEAAEEAIEQGQGDVSNLPTFSAIEFLKERLLKVMARQAIVDEIISNDRAPVAQKDEYNSQWFELEGAVTLLESRIETLEKEHDAEIAEAYGHVGA